MAKIKTSYKRDVVQDLETMLAEEMAKEIDKEIINDIHKLGFEMEIKEKLDNLLKRIVRNNKINDLFNE
jgi:hypothetical protein